MSLYDKQVLVIGGTGFVGSRLVERLLEAGAHVRVMLRNFGTAARIARFSIEMVRGDVTDAGSVSAATEGCNVVFHCAYGNSGDGNTQRVVTVQGTENVLTAALRAKVERVVYLSTLSVYGLPPDGDLDEKTPRRYSGSGYADSKLDAEKIAERYSKRSELPVVIIQPTIIYGPFGPLWTVDVLARLKTCGVTLINNGEGLCNAVYVDDVIEALLLAAAKPAAVGETFLISAETPITWRMFYEGFASMLKDARISNMSNSEASDYYAMHQRSRRLRKQLMAVFLEDTPLRSRLLETPELTKLFRITRALMPKPVWKSFKRRVKGSDEEKIWPELVEKEGRVAVPQPIHPIDVGLNASKVTVKIGKAKRLLGYQPLYDFDKGLQVTKQWARWANLLD